jgi:hypothetical protein
MRNMTFAFENEVGNTSIMRAVVIAVGGESLDVLTDGGTLRCDVLERGGEPPALARGDAVLVWHSGREMDRGVILGRIGQSRPPAAAIPLDEDAAAAIPAGPDAPDELVIEAKKTMTLRVGNGSITIRDDGKILIKGSDLISHAQRTNRIRGGAVSIN